VSFRDAYLRAEAGAARFLSPRFLASSARNEAVQTAARGVDPRVRAALVEQNAHLASTEARRRHLEALADPRVTTVVTGQQVGLFGGPLYAVHKAASAVRLAERLAAETNRPVVPIYWLQTEDHDLAEIAVHQVCDDRGGVHRLAVSVADAARRVSVAHRSPGSDVLVALDVLEQLLAPLPHGEEVVSLLGAA
jgi:bacillithiol synthase